MCCPADLQNARLNVAPSFSGLKLLSCGNGEFFSKLHLADFFIHFEEALWRNGGSRENSGKLSTEEMALLTGEGWVRVNGSIEVTGHNVLHKTCEGNELRTALR